MTCEAVCIGSCRVLAPGVPGATLGTLANRVPKKNPSANAVLVTTGNGFTALQTLFTGTMAKVASLIAIVIGGYQFAHGEPGGKKALAGVAAGTGIAVLAANVLTWLWGV